MAIQDDVDILGFEIARRVVLFKSGTVMPDSSTLGYNGDPNNATTNTNGEKLLRNSPIGTLYIEDDGTMWRKTVLSTNTWSELGTGSGTGGSGSSDTATQILTRGSMAIDMQGSGAIYLSLQENNFAADAYYADINPKHALVLPYEATLKRVVLRATGSAGNTAVVGLHSNRDITNTTSTSYKFFPSSTIESQSYTFSDNNESGTYTFTPGASASTGDTFGISISADGNIGLTSATVVIEYNKS